MLGIACGPVRMRRERRDLAHSGHSGDLELLGRNWRPLPTTGLPRRRSSYLPPPVRLLPPPCLEPPRSSSPTAEELVPYRSFADLVEARRHFPSSPVAGRPQSASRPSRCCSAQATICSLVCSVADGSLISWQITNQLLLIPPLLLI